MKDSELNQLVKDELRSEEGIDMANVVVSVQDNVVTLLGNQPSITALSSIENAVKRIGGVKAVVMEMEVKPDHDEPDDKNLAQTIVRLLEMNPSIPERQIQIVVESGVVTLSGTVQHHHERLLALNYIEALKGVIKVIDNIKIAKYASDANIKSAFIETIKRRAAIDESNIEVDVFRGVVYLNGVVRNLVEKESVVESAWSVPGVQFIIDRLELAPIANSSY